ncbi:ABC transporter permease [Desulfosporosinus sp. PR]|uniref:ABC transporter permease n=1 Tax=Candidatus Desulfosporosinus nitrosoreducens TaxID=3401928 RepID=UPI0027F8B3FC|nr:ABC transporter permease [Desulfosporosinus sp. PR]MDQ7093343.1 ABC transporter permease [Desulfosporosinus sp. PR]
MNRKLMGRWEIKKTNSSSALKKVVISLTSIVLGLVFAGIFVGITGKDPLQLYSEILQSSVGSMYGLGETIVEMIPLALCSLGVSLAFRMQLWNIGAEGQFYMGAFGATYFALFFSDLPKLMLLPLMLLAGFICGGVWALIPALPKAFWNVNETISSLLLNYVAYFWIAYLVYGPWKDPKGNNFPLTKEFAQSATVPSFGNTRITYAFLLMLILALVLFFVLKYSKWGYEIRVSGSSRKAADYAGMNYIKNVIMVMFLSGALSGMAGMAEVSGVLHRLQQTISPGYGYTAILIALLARLNPLSILLVSFLMGGLLVGGFSLQTSGFPSSMVSMFQGSILFFVLAGEIFNNYRLVRKKV